MSHVNSLSTAGDPAERTPLAARHGSGGDPQRLERLAPLIHQLLTWDLVTRSGSGEYVLRDDVQQRLQDLSSTMTPATVEVYLGRKCQSCGLVRVTRPVNGKRVCEACAVPAPEAVAPRAADVADGSEMPASPGHHVIRSRWHRKAS